MTVKDDLSVDPSFFEGIGLELPFKEGDNAEEDDDVTLLKVLKMMHSWIISNQEELLHHVLQRVLVGVGVGRRRRRCHYSTRRYCSTRISKNYYMNECFNMKEQIICNNKCRHLSLRSRY